MSSEEHLLAGLLTFKQAATELKKTPRTVDRYTKLPVDPLPTVRIGRQRFIDRPSARAWILRQTGATTVEPRKHAPTSSARAEDITPKRPRGRPRKHQQAAE